MRCTGGGYGAERALRCRGANGHLIGGTQAANAQAEERSWVQVIAFIDNPWRR
jgi:hypothetical protein